MRKTTPAGTFASLLLLVLLAPPAASALLAPPDCASRLPQVLNVGLPTTRGVEIDIADVQRRLESAAADVYSDMAYCASRPLHVNAVLGTDYQILDWLGREQIDVAVVPALSLHLLQRDGIDLVEPRELPEMSRGWLSSRAARLVSVDVSASGERRLRSPAEAAEDFGSFRAALLERAGASSPAPRLPTRMVFASHLSTTGFLTPVAEIHRWLEGELAARGDEDERDLVRAAFWRELLDHACFDFGAVVERGPSCRELEAAPEALREIRTVAETVEAPVAAGAGEPSLTFGEPVRDHLVILRPRARSVFVASEFDTAGASLPADLAPLFGESVPAADEEKRAVPAFASHRRAERYFGTRTFAFTVDESLRLLDLHQRLATTGGLALVLPGGGVKAAYQSRLIDRLYESRLENGSGEAAGAAGPPASGRLRVSHVIGTSGGALLGFFVARLGPDGPRDLSQILWFRPPPGLSGRTHERPLDSTDVFGWTDLPRYASLLTIFLVFCVGLTLVAVFAPGCLPASSAVVTAPRGSRKGLLVPMALVVAATPVLVMLIGRRLALEVEHVPEFEGLLYAVLMVLAMYADQCLVRYPDEAGAPRPSVRAARWLIAIGVVFMLAPTIARLVPRLHPLLGSMATFGFAYLALGVTATVLWLVTARRRRGAVGARYVGIAFGLFAAGSVAAFGVLAWAARRAPSLLERLDRMPLLFLALVATVVIVLVQRITADGGGAQGWYAELQRRGGALAETAAARWARLLLAPFLTCLLILDLTRPAARQIASSAMPWLSAQSKLDLPLGALAVCVGALLALLGLLLRLQSGGRGYRVENTRSFVDAMLLVVTGFALAVYLALGLTALLAPARFGMLELTWTFWKWLLAVSATFTVVLLAWALWRRMRGPERLREAVGFLCSRHPSANLICRRYARMLWLSIFGFLWWNLLLAPGLYGNRYASRYLETTEERFEEAARGLVGAQPMRLTAPLLATANALKTDGTRYFLVVPGGEPCPVIREPAGSGASWRRFHAIAGAHHDEEPDADTCVDLDLTLPGHREVMRRFVFASGSPFPIFPAHSVNASLEPEGEREALVDGGYSNNTPVEAAWRLGVERVLIVNSSHPLGGCPGGRWLDKLVGPLATNAARLPGFLFERSQQLDRRSRANLFVVSLSPLRRCDWPVLSDFRRTVVQRMLEAADEDLPMRIGMVESWGPPRFQVSAQVGGQYASGAASDPDEGEGESGSRASEAGPPPPARARAR